MAGRHRGPQMELQRLRKRFSYGLQAALLGVTLALLRALPLDWASGLGGFVARHVGPWVPVSRVGRRNLRAAFPDKSDAEIERILAGVWDNLGRIAVEFAHLEEFCVEGTGRHCRAPGAWTPHPDDPGRAVAIE